MVYKAMTPMTVASSRTKSKSWFAKVSGLSTSKEEARQETMTRRSLTFLVKEKGHAPQLGEGEEETKAGAVTISSPESKPNTPGELQSKVEK